MTKEQLSRMEELIELVDKHRIQYHIYDTPLISDKEYDKLFYELVDLENATGVRLPNSPTMRVGADPLEKFKKAKHLTRLYSLDKAQTITELEDWNMRNKRIYKYKEEYSVEYKFDGLAMEIVYENGILKRAVTRGNGEEGEEVTEQIRTIHTVPLTINYKGLIGIQGEAIMRLSELKKYNLNSNEPLKNARNAAAGAVRNLDPKETARRHLDFMAYNVNYREEPFETQQEIHQFLQQQGFCTGDYFVIANSTKEIEREIQKVDKIKDKLDYLIDGLVIKLNLIKDRKELGFTDRYPRGMVAYKYEPEETSTIITDVKWQVGRTGKLTPVATLEPIELAGATIVHSTLNNLGDIKRKDIKINSRVFIHRSNEVIPEITGVAEHYANSIDIEVPKKCPACGAELKEDGANLYCANDKNCMPQIVGRIVHFCSKNAMQIEGISKQTVLQLHKELGVNYPSDLYKITEAQLLQLDKFKDKKAKNTIDAINRSKRVNLSKFLYALGIDGVGKKTAKDLAKKFKTLEQIEQASREELIEMKDIAEITADNIKFYFEHHLEEVNKLLELGIVIIEENKKTSKKLAEERIVITGHLNMYSREQASTILENLGAEMQTSVSRNTTMLLVGEKPGSKLEKAKQLGIKIINEEEFLKLIKE